MSQPFAEYLTAPGANWSSIKHLEVSPLEYKHRLEHPRKDTPAMQLGHATHTAVLEPDRFPLEYTVYPGKVRRGKDWDAFAAANADKDILKADEYARCLAIRDAVQGHDVAADLLTGAETEMSIGWEDGATGLPCKGRIDAFDGGSLIDLKTTGEFGSKFAANAARFAYHKQLAFYRQGLRKLGHAVPGVLLIAVQSVAPHDVCVYRLPDELLDWAWTEVRGLLELLKKCQAKDEWPGAAANVVDLELPLWAYPDEEMEPRHQLTKGGESFAL